MPDPGSLRLVLGANDVAHLVAGLAWLVARLAGVTRQVTTSHNGRLPGGWQALVLGTILPSVKDMSGIYFNSREAQATEQRIGG